MLEDPQIIIAFPRFLSTGTLLAADSRQSTFWLILQEADHHVNCRKEDLRRRTIQDLAEIEVGAAKLPSLGRDGLAHRVGSSVCFRNAMLTHLSR